MYTLILLSWTWVESCSVLKCSRHTLLFQRQIHNTLLMALISLTATASLSLTLNLLLSDQTVRLIFLNPSIFKFIIFTINMAKSSWHNCVRTLLECFDISSTIFTFCALSIQSSTGAGTKDGGNSLSKCNMKVLRQISNRVLHIRNTMKTVFTLGITACILVFWPPSRNRIRLSLQIQNFFARVF